MQCSLRLIARQLGRSASTISREVSRNRGSGRYRASRSDQAAWDRALHPKLCKLACRPFLSRTVSIKLRQQWSLEQIAGWLKRTYRLQADRFGDLDHATRQVLDRTVAKETGPAMSARLASFDKKRTELTPGTVLVREWDRRSQRVMVMADGFAWNGRTYDSLSKVAFAITGTKWNGPRFFGLRDKEDRPALEAQS
jgi:hypothetical protein